MNGFFLSSPVRTHLSLLRQRYPHRDSERNTIRGLRGTSRLGLTLALMCMFGSYMTPKVSGEEVVILSEEAPVQIREKIVAQVRRDDRFDVLQRSGPWVAIAVQQGQNTIRGWVLSKHLRNVVDDVQIAPGEPTAIAPGLEFEIDRLQVFLQGSRGYLSLQATITNTGDTPVRYNVTNFGLLIEDQVISATNFQQDGIRYGGDQLMMGLAPGGRMVAQWAQPHLLLSSGELAVGTRIEKWIRFPMNNFARDTKFAELNVILSGKIGDNEFKIDLKRKAIEGLDLRARAAEFNPTVQVIEVHDGINALNYAEVLQHLPKDRWGLQAIVLCQTPAFYLDRYVLEKLGNSNYRPGNQDNPFVFVATADMESNRSPAGGSYISAPNLLFAATETEAALHILGGRPDTTELLIENADHEDARIRTLVARMLGLKIHEPKSLQTLIQATEDKDDAVRSAAVMALTGSLPMPFGPNQNKHSATLGLLPREAINAMVDLMQDGSNTVRLTAIRAAAQVNDPLIVQALIDQLRNEDESILASVCSSLGLLQARNAIEPLQSLRESDSRPNRSSAIRALGSIGGLTPIEAALAQLEQGEPNYSDFQILNQNADERAVEPLIAYLESSGNNHSFIEQAADILGQLGDQRATKALIAQLRYGNDYSEKVPKALGQLKDPAAIEPLWEASQAANMSSSRKAAVFGALVQLGDTQVISHLMTLLNKPTNDMPVGQLLPILGNTENPLATRLLAQQLDDAKNARFAAQGLLQQGTPFALKMLERKLLSEDYAQGNNLLSTIYSSQSPAKMELVYLASRSPNRATQQAAENYRRFWEQTRWPEHVNLVDRPAFPLAADAWINSPKVTAADFEDRVVLLNFWAVWNGPCLAAFPHLRQWHDTYAKDGLTVVGLTRFYGYGWDQQSDQPFRMSRRSVEDEIDALAQFAHYHDLKFPMAVLEADSELLTQYAVQGMPQMVLIDRSGNIRLIRVGSNEESLQVLEAQIKKCLYEVDFANSLVTEDDLAELRMTGIRLLNLQDAQVSDTALAKVPAHELTSLKLDGANTSNAGLQTLAKNGPWQHLRELSLSATRITDEAVEYLQAFPSLEVLHLAAEGITDGGLERLTQLQSIKALYLGDGWGAAGATMAGLTQLAALPKLEHLGLNGLPLTDEAIAVIQDFPSLRSVGLVSTKITAGGVNRLRNARPDINIETDEWSGWLSREKYQAHFADMARRGTFPLEVEGKLTEEGTRYRAHFVPQPKDSEFEFNSMHGNTFEQFLTRRQSVLVRGLTTASLAEFTNQNGQTEYSGTWIKGRPESYWKTPQLEAQRAYERAVKHLHRGDAEAALALLEVATGTAPDHYRAHILKGRILRKQDKALEAGGAFRAGIEIIEQLPESHRLAGHWGWLGQGLYRLDRLPEARHALQTAIAIRRENAPTLEDGPRWWYFIMTLHRMGATRPAAEYLKQLAPQVTENSPSNHQELLAETSALIGEVTADALTPAQD